MVARCTARSASNSGRGPPALARNSEADGAGNVGVTPMSKMALVIVSTLSREHHKHSAQASACFHLEFME